MACSQDFAADPRNANANRQAGNLARSVSDRAHCAVNHCANASINSRSSTNSNARSALTARWPMCGHPKLTPHFALTRPFALLCALPWVMTT